MTRGIFDPGGGETEHSGSAFLGPEGQNASRLPPDVIDGAADGGEQETLEAIDRAGDTPPLMARDDDEAARRLTEMTEGGEDAGHAES
jgi:hypothetical protein